MLHCYYCMKLSPHTKRMGNSSIHKYQGRYVYLILHVPIILLLFYGLLEIENQSPRGLRLGIIMENRRSNSVLVHKIFVKRKTTLIH